MTGEKDTFYIYYIWVVLIPVTYKSNPTTKK